MWTFQTAMELVTTLGSWGKEQGVHSDSEGLDGFS